MRSFTKYHLHTLLPHYSIHSTSNCVTGIFPRPYIHRSLRPQLCRPPPKIIRPHCFPSLSPPSIRVVKIMSRRPTPGQAAQNSQTIKSLLKLEHNKICADCKRNKRQSPIPSVELRPRWLHLQVHSLGGHILNSLLFRSAMGFLEPGCVCLHSVLGHSQGYGNAYQSSQVRGSRCLDR
jgi:hypothetical protein